jgi:hypothetical protein
MLPDLKMNAVLSLSLFQLLFYLCRIERVEIE